MRCNLIFFILLVFITAVIVNAQMTGEAITGKASAQQVGMNISVVSTLPTLTIISPMNKNYINEWVLLNYTTTNAQSIWYKLNNGPNITINFPFYFNVSEGSHTLYLYANNSAGTNFTNITFAVNLTLFIINYSKWQGAYMGDSTNFSRYSYEEMQNLSNIIFEHISYGKMFFYEEINFTHDANWSDNFLDFNSYINLSFNRIELNASVLPNFNRSATLRLYNLTLINPRIARDGFVCPSNICVIESYSNSVLVFNVTGFSTYSAEETPSETTSPKSSGGSGGGGKIIKNFTLDKEKIQITLKQEETKYEEIKINNTGNIRLKIDLLMELENLSIIDNKSFYLNAGKSKTVLLNFAAKENTPSDVYVGKLVVNAEGIKKEVLIAMEVESKAPLFDVKVEIPEKFLYVLPGENMLATIKLYSLGKDEREDVTINYAIKNEKNEIIKSEHETMAVLNQTSLIKEMNIPKNTEFGNYIFYVKVTYGNQAASSSAFFQIGKFLAPDAQKIMYAIIGILIIVIFVIIYKLRIMKRQIKARIKIDEDILAKEKLIKRRR